MIQSFKNPEPLNEIPNPEMPTAPVAVGLKADTLIGPEMMQFILMQTLIPQHRDDPNVIKFIKSYLECRSVSQAADEANITRRAGKNLKARPDINEAILKITDKAVLKHGYDAGEVIERVKEIMDVDPVDLQNKDGSFKETFAEMSPEARRGIKKFKAKNLYDLDPNGMKIVVGKLIEVEFWDKMKAVELLGREKNIFKETKVHQHDLTQNMSSVLLESRQRAEERVAAMAPVLEIEARDVSDGAE